MTKPIDSLSLQNKFKRYYQQKLTDTLKKPKIRASSAAVFSFLAVSLFMWYAVRPTAQTIIYLRREISDKTELNKQMEDKITALIEGQAAYEEIEDKIPLVLDALPYNPDGVILARQLRNIADISGSSISAIQIPALPLLAKEATPSANAVAIKPLEEFPITVIITGQYENIKSFLTGLLLLRRATTIHSVSIKQFSQRDERNGSLQLSIALKSYYTTQ